jgi:hypothetical protein
VFKRIAEATLRYLGVGPTINPDPPVLVAREDAINTSGPSENPPSIRVINDGPPGTMPDLQGMSARDALRRLVKIGLTARFEGDGFVVAQDPPSGAVLDGVGQCRLTLNRPHNRHQDHARP